MSFLTWRLCWMYLFVGCVYAWICERSMAPELRQSIYRWPLAGYWGLLVALTVFWPVGILLGPCRDALRELRRRYGAKEIKAEGYLQVRTTSVGTYVVKECCGCYGTGKAHHFVCPRCGGNRFNSEGAANLSQPMIRHCKSEPCGFQWLQTADSKVFSLVTPERECSLCYGSGKNTAVAAFSARATQPPAYSSQVSPCNRCGLQSGLLFFVIEDGRERNEPLPMVCAYCVMSEDRIHGLWRFDKTIIFRKE